MTRDQRLVLTIAVLASFVSFLDGTIVNVALPAIMRDLGGGIATQQWVVDAYAITLGALILVAGSVSDVYGRITVIRVGLIAFGIASVAIALDPSAGLMIGARAIQGVAGALLVPSSLALITSNFRGPAQSRAIGIWTAGTTVASIAGPVVGGLFVDLLSWRFAFLINVLPIAVTLWLLLVLGHKDRREPGVAIDWPGAVLCTLGLGGPVFALIEQSNFGWSAPVIWIPLVLGLACFAAFVVRQRTAAQPMMPLTLFRVRNFWSGNIATALIYAGLSLLFFALGIYLQEGAGLKATLAGLAALPATALLILLSSRVGTLAGRIGARLFMTAGPLIMAVGVLLILSIGVPFNYWWQVLPGVVVFGFGLSVTVSPLTSAILGAIPSEQSGIASAVNNAVSRVAALLIVAMIGIIVGGAINLGGLHRALIVAAILMAAGGVVSFAGIRKPVVTTEPVPAQL